MSMLNDAADDVLAPLAGTGTHHVKHFGASLAKAILIPRDLWGKHVDIKAMGAACEYAFQIVGAGVAAPTAWTFGDVSTFDSPARTGMHLAAGERAPRQKVPAAENGTYSVYLVVAGASAASELYLAPSEGIGLVDVNPY